MTSHEMKRAACPACHTMHDRATVLLQGTRPDTTPHTGDLTICIRCGRWLEFTKEMSLRLLTAADILGLPNNVFQAMRSATQACYSDANETN